MSLDFVTVTFGQDLPLLRLQARSMRLHLAPEACGSILVIGNDPSDPFLAERFRQEVLPEYGHLRAAVHYLPGEEVTEFGGMPRAGSGWRRQQGLKLDAHRFVNATAYVTLDSKNHFIRPTGEEAFRTAEGLLRTRPRGARPEHMGAFRYLGLPEAAWPGEIFHIVTPMPLDVAQVGAMDRHFRERGHASVGAFLASDEDVYEYRLYCAFLVLNRGGWEGLHSFDMPPAHSFFARTDSLADVLRAADHPAARMLGIHRRAGWCAAEDRAAIVTRWIRFGLVADAAEGEAILAPPPGAKRPA